MSTPRNPYRRPQAAELARRLAEPRRFIQVVAGPRQVGKSTLVQQVVEELAAEARYASADEPTLRGAEWIAQQWEAARLAAREAGKRGAVLALDEIQKIPGWSETVKRLWDEDTRRRVPLKAVLLGSAPLLIARGMSESLAGRFELLRLPHWSFAEMRAAFGVTLDEYLLLRRLSGRGLAHRRTRALAALHRRQPDRNLDFPRRAAAHARGQAGAAAPPVRARLPLLGADPVVHEDARAAAGRRQHDDARALP